MLSNFTKALTILLILASYSFAQTSKYNSISKSVLINLDGGLTAPYTDYKTPIIDYFVRASFEYFFPSSTPINFGLRLFGTIGYVSAEDNIRQPDFYRTNINSFGGGLILIYSIDETFYPYLFGGASLLSFSPKNINGVLLFGNSNNLYSTNEVNYSAELGFKIPISSKMKINLGGNVNISPRDYIDDIESGKHNDIYFSAFAGLSFALFAQYDSDNDGIKNDYDNCPDTPAGISVDEYGCPLDTDKDGIADYIDICPSTPLEVKVDKNGCPLDMDSDGVYDYLDKCLGTPAGVKVDSKGCPLDDDRDGVPNYKDKCLDSKYGEEVDEYGCAKVSEKTPIKGIENEMVLNASTSFEFNSAKLLSSALPLLEEIFWIIVTDKSNSRWRIEGHTDNIGSDEANIKLSTLRAQTIFDYFVKSGLKPDRFDVVGLGKQFPIADNNTELGRAKNRRVRIYKID